MKILVINGPNINMLGKREDMYGTTTYPQLVRQIKKYSNHKCICFQSNSEEKIINIIQNNLNKVDGIIINPAAFTHTSIAIRDALLMHKCPIIEVHITDTKQREDFRKINYISEIVTQTIQGQGIKGYFFALDILQKTQ